MSEQDIFLEALEIADLNKRVQFLDQACGNDSALRKQVESLLNVHDQQGQFMETPALQQLADQAAKPQKPVATSEKQAFSADGHQDECNLSFLEPSTTPGSLGRLQHFEIHQVVGRGAFGIVLKAFDTKLHRIVAIKVMTPELAVTSPARKRFLREGRSAAAVRHENVVSIYAVEDEPLPFLVMEFIDGRTLQQKIDQTGPLEIIDILKIGRQVAKGLEAAHDKGLIHRDIKPANILLESGSERVILTDFGLARAADDASLTQSGFIAGTPLYMSPEQAQGRKIDHRSDLFSLGSVLYVMCSGRPPFRAASTVAVIRRVVDDQPRPIQEIIPEVPDWLVKIVEKLHTKDPDQRFPSARKIGNVLGQCLSKLQQGKRVTLESKKPAATTRIDLESPSPSERESLSLQLVEFLRSIRKSVIRFPLSLIFILILPAVLLFSITERSGLTGILSSINNTFFPKGTLAASPVPHRPASITPIQNVPGELPALQAVIPITEPCTWEGTRTYQKGAFSPSTVPYELKIEEVNGSQFKGVVFHNGKHQNGTRITGNIEENVLTWAEIEDVYTFHLRGVASGDQLAVTFTGNLASGETTSGEAVLKRDRPSGESASSENGVSRIPLHVSGGDWAGRYRFEEGVLTQERIGNSVISFGNPEWDDYDFAFETMAVEGIQGADVYIRTGHKDGEYRLIIGMNENPVQLWKMIKNSGHYNIGEKQWMNLKLKQWYNVKICLRGSNIRISLDGKEIYNIHDQTFSKGHVGFLTFNSSLKWRNLTVKAPDGTLLWEGFPEIPFSHQAPVQVAADTDRKAAEWVLSQGGRIRIAGHHDEIHSASQLPNHSEIVLTHLNLTGNSRVTDEELLEHLSGTINLRNVDLSFSSNISDPGLLSLHGNTNLNELRLHKTKVTGSGFYHLQDCRGLRVLQLSQSPVFNEALWFLHSCPNLQLVWIADTPTITSDSIKYLGGNKNVQYISVRNTPFDDKGLVSLKNRPQLRSLDLSGTRITDAGMSQLADCKLETLYLHHTQIGDRGIRELQSIKYLKRLGLRNTKVTTEGLEELKKMLPECNAYLE